MKFQLTLIILCMIAISSAQPDSMSIKQVMEIYESDIKGQFECLEAEGDVDDKKRIDKLKSVVNFAAVSLDTSPAKFQAPVKKLIIVLRTEIEKMEASGKFDTSVLDFSKAYWDRKQEEHFESE